MATETRIRIVKRSESREPQAASAEQSRASTQDSAEGARRDAVTVVTGWVQELRRKKVAEAARGFDSLFNQSTAGATRS